MLQTINTDNLPVVNVADSLKMATAQMVEQIKAEPGVFFDNLLHQMISFGIKVLAALLLYMIGAWIIKIIRNRMKKAFERKGTEGTISSFTLSLTSIVLYILLIITSISVLGINTTSIAALLAAGGVAIGMALSGTVQNFAGGIILLIFKPFKAGDYISAQNVQGTVQSVSIMSTRILTADNRIVVIPNGDLSNGTIDNYSATGLRRIDWTVSVAYGSDSDKCMQLLADMLKSEDKVLDSGTEGAQDVFVALSSLNANDISFVARAWVRSEDYWSVFFKMNNRIYTELPKAGFSFAFPQLDVTIRKP